jgi:hypothetical protein
MLTQAREQCFVHTVGIDRELLCVCESRLFCVAERAALEVEKARELRLRRTVPRSLRGV